MTPTTPEAEAVEVLACPFCGYAAGAVKVPGRVRQGAWSVGCIGPDCLARQGGFDTQAEAIAAWNTRTPPKEADRE